MRRGLVTESTKEGQLRPERVAVRTGDEADDFKNVWTCQSSLRRRNGITGEPQLRRSKRQDFCKILHAAASVEP